MKKIKVFEFKKFDAIANKVSFSEIKNNLLNCHKIDLIPKEKIVKLNIHWAPLYCVCSKEEWSEIYKILNDNGISIKKWTILDFFSEISRPLFIFIIYLLLVMLILILYIRIIISR